MVYFPLDSPWTLRQNPVKERKNRGTRGAGGGDTMAKKKKAKKKKK